MRTVNVNGQDVLVIAERYDDEGAIVTAVLVPSGDGKTYYAAPRTYVGAGDANSTTEVTDPRVALWDAATTYRAGNRARGPGDTIWLSLMDGNLGNSLGPTMWWRQLHRTLTREERQLTQADALARFDALTDEEIAARAEQAMKRKVE